MSGYNYSGNNNMEFIENLVKGKHLILQSTDIGMFDFSIFERDINCDNTDNVITYDNKKYYNFNGNTTIKLEKFIYIPDSISEFTVEGYIFLTPEAKNPSINVDIIAGINENTYYKGFYIGITTSGLFRFSTGNGNRHASYYDGLPVNETFHFAWVFDGLSKRLYINGLLKLNESLDVGYRDFDNPPNITIGYMNYDNKLYGGEYSKIISHQLIVHSTVKYNSEFTPEYIDYSFIKNGFVSGTTRKRINEYSHDTIPVSCYVSVHDVDEYNNMVADTVSDDNGLYRFINLKSNHRYVTIAKYGDDVTVSGIIIPSVT